MSKKILSLSISFCIVTIATLFAAHAYAGGGRIDMSAQGGFATTIAAQVVATLYMDDQHTQPSAGEQGQIVFENAASGQYCNTTQPISDSEGKIKAECHSPLVGAYVAKLALTSGEERTVAMNFNSPPPSPQVLSGQYTLTPSQSSVSFTNALNTGYGLGVTLRDKQSNEVIRDQTGIEYDWLVGNSDIVRLTETMNLCIDGVQAPCPRVNGQFQGYKPGTTTVRIITRKTGQVLAETSVTMSVSQAQGPAHYTPPAPQAVLATPSPSPTTSPRPSATPRVSAPTAPYGSAANEDPIPTGTPSPEPSAAVTATTDSSENNTTASDTLTTLLVFGSVVAGMGLPIGWYLLETNPSAKAHFFKKITEYKSKMPQVFKKKTPI